ncbi:hypothetical protein [Actinokineospora sp. NPDC004072]
MADLDVESYVDDVVVPIQTGWSPHNNYFRVYRIRPDASDAEVDDALSDMPDHWGAAGLRQHALAFDRLHACHEQAAVVLRDPARRARHRATVEREHRALVAVVRHRLHGAPAMPPGEVAALVGAAEGRWSRPDVVAALAAAGAEVRAADPLPRPVRPKRWQRLREHLADLPHDSLWEYLTGTPDLDGASTQAVGLEARRKLLRVARDRAADAERSVIALVRLWIGEPGGLAAVLAHELVADLAAAAVCGYAAVRDLADPKRCAAANLPPDPDALAYAVWAARAESPWTAGYTTAVAERRLRDALALLDAHPLPELWWRTRGELADRLARLDTELAHALALIDTAPEDAAARLLAVGRELADNAVAEGLRRCPAAPPGAVDATVDGDRVVVRWRPSPSTAGRIGYRVTRGAITLAAETRTLSVVDEDVPVGPDLVYTVTTVREGEPGMSASSEPVAVRPEVTDLRVTSEPGMVVGEWCLPRAALRAVADRVGDGAVMAGDTGFVDQQVTPGHEYVYRVRVDYPEGRSSGVVARVVCLREPDAVADLRAVASGDVVELTWTPPGGALVEIRVLTRPGGEKPGVVRPEQADHVGPLLAASRTGRARVDAADLALGRTFVPVTVSGPLAAIGTAAVLDISPARVDGLRATRFGPEVRLTWHWPAWAHDALVVWRPGAPPDGPADAAARRMPTTRTAYLSRGVRVSAAEPGDHWFGVCVADRGDYGPLTTVWSPCPVQARYRISGRFRTRAIAVEGDAGLPDVVVVAQTGRRPLAPEDGMTLAVLPGGARTSGTEFAVPAALRRPVYLRAFSLDDSVWLRHPDPRELVVR